MGPWVCEEQRGVGALSLPASSLLEEPPPAASWVLQLCPEWALEGAGLRLHVPSAWELAGLWPSPAKYR